MEREANGERNPSMGALIRAARVERGMKQRELAERLGVTDKAVSKWENGVSHS